MEPPTAAKVEAIVTAAAAAVSRLFQSRGLCGAGIRRDALAALPMRFFILVKLQPPPAERRLSFETLLLFDESQLKMMFPATHYSDDPSSHCSADGEPFKTSEKTARKYLLCENNRQLMLRKVLPNFCDVSSQCTSCYNKIQEIAILKGPISAGRNDFILCFEHSFSWFDSRCLQRKILKMQSCWRCEPQWHKT